MHKVTIDELRRETAVPVVIADHNGSITYVNEPFGTLIGCAPDEMIGRPIATIIPRKLRDSHNLGFSRFLMTEQPTLLGKPLVLNVVTKDGREVASEHLIVAEKTQGQWAFGAIIRPIVAR